MNFVFHTLSLFDFVYTDSIPTFHHYFPRTNRTAVLVTELLGKTVSDLRRDFNPFSTVTVLRIGLQVVSLSLGF